MFHFQKRLEIEETDVQNPQGVVGIHHLLDPVIVMAEETLSEILVLAGWDDVHLPTMCADHRKFNLLSKNSSLDSFK